MPVANPFWDYSLAVYGKPGVAEACLRLQDEVGVDVNLLLFFCWLATVRNAALDGAAVRDVVERTEGWRNHVVRPLRGVRRWMKGEVDGMAPDSVESLRYDVKRIELESERLQQDMLFALAGFSNPVRRDLAAVRRDLEANINNYLTVIGASRTEALTQACGVVAAAAVSV